MGVAVDLRVIGGGLSEQRGALRPKRLHAGDSAHRGAALPVSASHLNIRSSEKRSSAVRVVTGRLTEVFARHRLTLVDLAAIFDRPMQTVASQLDGSRAFPVEQLALLHEPVRREACEAVYGAHEECLADWKESR